MKYLLGFLFFLLLTIIATHPLLLHIQDTLPEPGDSLLNTWVINWGIKKILTDPPGLFHANIFHPYKYTLAYTEHMLGNAVLGVPVYLITTNPILVYNFVLMATFVLAGWGMFLLVSYLSKSSFAGIVAGVIFAFNPHRFYELGHIHVLSLHWLPFTLLYLHRYAAGDRRKKDLFLFSFFFVLQSITSGHIGLYQNFIVILFLFFMLISRDNIGFSGCLKLGIALCISFLVLIPLYFPYIHLAHEMKFTRPESELKLYSAAFSDFSGIISSGLLVFILAVLGIFHTRDSLKKGPGFLPALINVLSIITLLIVIYVIIFGGFDSGYKILGIELKVKDIDRPLYIFFGLLALRLFLQKKAFLPSRFYLVLALASFLFSLGPEINLTDNFTCPYKLLYAYFPGFKGLRVPSRWMAIFMFAISVLAGFGWKKMERLRWSKVVIFPIVIFFILHSYISIPMPLLFTTGDKPPVYDWLEKQSRDSVIIELPMPDWYHDFYKEAVYMYWSLFHNKRMVNGYSGYSPPTYWPIVELMRSFPSCDSIRLLQYLDVRYIILHDAVQSGDFNMFQDDVILRYRDEKDAVYELVSGFRPAAGRSAVRIQGLPLLVSASHNPGKAGYACDNDMTTRWDTGEIQSSGMWVQLDFGEVFNISKITLYLGKHTTDYPRGLILEISEDAADWVEVDLGFLYSEFIISLFKDPLLSRIELDFGQKRARYVRLSISSGNPMFHWSIYEIGVYQ